MLYCWIYAKWHDLIKVFTLIVFVVILMFRVLTCNNNVITTAIPTLLWPVSQQLTGIWNICSVSSSNTTTHVRSRPLYGDAWGLAYTAIIELWISYSINCCHISSNQQWTPSYIYRHTVANFKTTSSFLLRQESLANAKVSVWQPWYIGHNLLDYP